MGEATLGKGEEKSRWETQVSPEDRLVRAGFFRVVVTGMILVYLAYAIHLGSDRAILVNSVSLALMGLSWVSDRYLPKSKLGAQLLLVGGLVIIFGAALGDSHLEGSGFWHIPLLSVGAGFLMGTRAAICWAVVGGASIGSQSYFHFFDPLVRDYPYTRENVLMMRMFGILAAGFFGHIMSRTNRERVEVFRRQMQDMQAASVRAGAANVAKTRFLAQVSHELRTPMNGILGMTQFLQHRSSLAPKAKAHVQTIHRCSNSLLGLFSEILDLSRIESAGWNIQRQPINIVAVVKEVGELFAAQANNPDRCLRVMTSHDDFWIIGDAVRLSQILSNLVGNAVKFCERGEISVELEIQPLSHPTPEQTHRIEISVRDQGVGMSESQELAVFCEYMQIRSRQSDEAPEGTGLGLVISRELVQRMGGSLEVSSSLDVGTTFSVQLEAQACSPPETGTPSPEESMVAITKSPVDSDSVCALRVLVVDDLAINRRVASLTLRRLGCDVDEAQDGETSVRMANKKAYDCIFMDLRMPGMDGYQAASRILESSTSNQQTPIIALSASAFDEDRRRCFEVGMVAHVAKPFRASDLCQVLRTYAGASLQSANDAAVKERHAA